MPAKKKKESKAKFIKGSDVLKALQAGLNMFDYDKKLKKHVKNSAHNQKQLDEALELANEFKSIAGQLNTGAAKHFEALNIMIEQAK